MTLRARVRVIALASLLAAASVLAQPGAGGEHWIGIWSTAVVGQPPAPPPQPVSAPSPSRTTAAAAQGRGGPAARPRFTLSNQTIRQIAHVTHGAGRIRVVVSNVFGTAPVSIGAAHVARREKDSRIAAGSARPLLFSGRPAALIPAGAVLVSDPIDVKVEPFDDLAIDLYVPGDLTGGPSPVTMHAAALQTNYVSATGNHSGAADLPGASPITSSYLLSRVEGVAPAETRVVATFGDSITDGTRSTVDTNHRWPNVLARRLVARGQTSVSVVNLGISGNRLLSDATAAFGINALARFDRDVLSLPGVTHLVVLEGINDIGTSRQGPDPTTEALIAAHQQIVARARAHGIRVYGGTLLPFEGAGYFSAEGEAKRLAVNEWIRGGKGYDAVIDFDRAVRDPAHPARLLAKYDSGDHLHPNDAGYEAMANAIDLGLFAN